MGTCFIKQHPSPYGDVIKSIIRLYVLLGGLHRGYASYSEIRRMFSFQCVCDALFDNRFIHYGPVHFTL